MTYGKISIANMPLYWMPRDVRGGQAYLGRLDFLDKTPSRGVAQYLPLFIREGPRSRARDGPGRAGLRRLHATQLRPSGRQPALHVGGGPGTAENSDWNSIFGSALARADAHVMRETLRRILSGTPASLYAGLGSAFAVLACERVRLGGRVALVLPATALTGSRWVPVRAMLLEDFDVEWVVGSHDSRNRPAWGGLPGRSFVSFSESTRIAEALVVATRRNGARARREPVTRFVNLRRNPDEPIDAMAVTRALLAAAGSDGGPAEIAFRAEAWGEVLPVEQTRLDTSPWVHATF